MLNSRNSSVLNQLSSSSVNRMWHVLCWNVRGINRSDRWPHLRNKIEESNASIVCLQETKKKRILMRASLKNLPRNILISLSMSTRMELQVAYWFYG
jgi:endonuclease/exonuclease/phosphatase family metal-dependent hydrolase